MEDGTGRKAAYLRGVEPYILKLEENSEASATGPTREHRPVWFGAFAPEWDDPIQGCCWYERHRHAIACHQSAEKAVFPRHRHLVRGGLSGPHGGPVRRVAGHRRRPSHPDPRPHRIGQDAGRLPLHARPSPHRTRTRQVPARPPPPDPPPPPDGQRRWPPSSTRSTVSSPNRYRPSPGAAASSTSPR